MQNLKRMIGDAKTFFYRLEFFFPVLIVSLFLLLGCNSKKISGFGGETTELKDFKTFIAVEDNILATPTIVKYDDNHLFVYDKAKGRILKLSSNGSVINTYGRAGRGPGEYLWVNNLFLTKDYLYILDTRQYFIQKYAQKGKFISTFDYGKIMNSGRPNTPSAPFSYSAVRPEDISNQPVVTASGNVLLSSVNFSEEAQTTYELRNWRGDYISGIGEVPAGSRFLIDYKAMRTAVENHEIPAYYKSSVFAISDKANPKEYFLIYNSFPKILKYNSEGKKLWEEHPPHTAAIDSIENHFYSWMQKATGRERITLSYYIAGVSSPQGDLFLIMNTKPLTIHQFSEKGKLMHIYKLYADEATLVPIFDIDFKGRRIFVVTEEGAIRVYPF